MALSIATFVYVATVAVQYFDVQSTHSFFKKIITIDQCQTAITLIKIVYNRGFPLASIGTGLCAAVCKAVFDLLRAKCSTHWVRTVCYLNPQFLFLVGRMAPFLSLGCANKVAGSQEPSIKWTLHFKYLCAVDKMSNEKCGVSTLQNINCVDFS